MKLYSAIFAVITLFSTAEACKCWNSYGRHVSEYTHACCTYTGGIFNNGNCDGDIFDKIGVFTKCCENLGTESDCECPDCPQEDARRKSLSLAPMTDAERADFAAKKSEKQRSVPFIG
ncbi:uncharacterized protein TRIVIDRAFT_220441 [Trichoderma virens Gv29-8]|uniref:Uncharacterized protein n=1 Tax=Hypocrea virens (strain Gv29-8 / FGSC 10586) TaxID=413071 RepID=G9MLB6_HYPVG|nr:uncharacterized protein TRIVIDRAFT_220441 [Trichoderma virens Gv29-8]EHK25006.1 hypothetical protein TRIVIDRAFT_220441 [Trichoderma virens Gv29-8]UKZ55272.1 hypothetical protein TrVGV298_009092 [Trichoderma virens]UKZ81043.1 hypothetical protein TrVFT333_008811 [Trichoderma virens FT-333]